MPWTTAPLPVYAPGPMQTELSVCLGYQKKLMVLSDHICRYFRSHMSLLGQLVDLSCAFVFTTFNVQFVTE